MAFIKKFNRRAKVETETGLSTNSNFSGRRFFNNDGTTTIQRTGQSFWEGVNIYYSLLAMPRWKFGLLVFVFFIGINLFFAGLYLIIGIENLNGMEAFTPLEKFGEAFFFSAQTFTTVGYGRINPIGFWASTTAAIEALIGLMSFAVATGLLYGRFARPKAYIRYSKNAIFAPFKEGLALMFRMVPYTQNQLVNVEVKVTVAMKVSEDGQLKNKFFNAVLDVSKANTMAANWTLVHIINEESPLYHLSKEDIDNANVELLIFVQGFDESFSNTVVSRASYLYNEFIYGAKFLPMFSTSSNGQTTLLHIDKLNDYELTDISHLMHH